MAIGFFTITPERSLVADPTTPYLYDNAAIIFRKSGAGAENYWTFFTQPFQKHLYSVVAGSLVAVLLLLVLLEKCHWNLSGDQSVLSGQVSSLQWVATDFLILLAGLVSRCKLKLLYAEFMYYVCSPDFSSCTLFYSMVTCARVCVCVRECVCTRYVCACNCQIGTSKVNRRYAFEL